MKTLAAIWIAVLLSGTGATVYVNHTLDEVALQNTMTARQLQPADNTVQVTSTIPLQSDGGATDIQPALGYKALNWETTNLKVQQ